jgi:hypothetical protein
MKKQIILSAACTFVFVLNGSLCAIVTGQGQEKPKQKKQDTKIDIKDPNHPLRRPVDPALVLSTIMPFGVAGGNTVSLPAELNFERQVVKGAPFSADLITETVQLLPDGNKIPRQTVSSIARDKDGRTRFEQSSVPPIAMVENLAIYKSIVISDPVSRQIYKLQPASRIAYKSPRPRASRASATAGTTGNPKNANVPANTEQSSIRGTSTSQEKPVSVSSPQISPANGTGNKNSENRKESLGKEVIEGVEAEGTRTIQTIPADTAGNKGPIEIIDEKWYSPALKMFILIKHSETGKGETTYRLTNIFRSEPDASLFRIPVDYKIQEQPK